MIAAVAEEKSGKSSEEERPPPEKDKVPCAIIADEETIRRPSLRMETGFGVRRCGRRNNFPTDG